MFYFNTDSFTLSENPRSIAARHIYEAKYKSARKHTSGFEENEEFKNSKLSLFISDRSHRQRLPEPRQILILLRCTSRCL